jgi:hypothetical protein
MALVIKDRVKESSTTTGTGAVSLAGAATGFVGFSTIGDGNTTYYAIVSQTPGEWEVGVGTYTASGSTLSRDSVLASSNSNSLVDFAAGAKDVFVTYPADRAVSTDLVQTLTNKTLTAPISTGEIYDNGSVRGNIVAVAALDIDCTVGNFFTKTISANSTFTFSNPPASRAYGFTLELTHTSGSVTWPVAVEWPSATAPTITAGKTSLFMFVTDDGGTRWRGAALVDYTT